jgi:hypothetical protein
VAQHRHKRDTNARRLPRVSLVAAPLAVLVTAPAVALGVAVSDPVSPVRDLLDVSAVSASLTAADLDRTDLSRSGGRNAAQANAAQENAAQAKAGIERRMALQQAQRATTRAVRAADTRLWTTTDLNLWSDATGQAVQRGEIEAGKRVLVTGRRDLGRVEVVVDGGSRWVTAGYLSPDEPVLGIGGACTNGSSVSSGVSPNIVAVHTAVCAAFPTITTYGTFRGGGGDHPLGRAVDIMVSGSLGWDVANFVRENYAALGVSYVIYSQNIWSVERAGEGWRAMSDRGSTTANHYDHVHVSTY